MNAKIDFVVMGCDGIWETLSAQDICRIANQRLTENKSQSLSSICEELLDKLVAKDTTEGTGCDNMSLILIQFRE